MTAIGARADIHPAAAGDLKSGQDAAGAVRQAWIDNARGVGIILVVIGHAARGVAAAGLGHGAAWSWFDYALYSFHMPLFFLLSGLYLPRGVARGRRDYVASKAWTVAYPYFLWSLLQGSVLVVLSSLTNGHTEWSDLTKIGWAPLPLFWFLYALFVCQMAYMLLEGRRLLAWLTVGAALIASQFFAPNGLPERILHALPFVFVGALLSNRIRTWCPTRPGLWAGLLLILLVAGVAFAGPLSQMNFDTLTTLPVTLVGIAAVLLVAQAVGRSQSWLGALGRASMSIYVMHVLVTAGLRIAIQKAHLPIDGWGIAAISSAGGVAAPWIVHNMLERWGVLWLFGLAPFPFQANTATRRSAEQAP